MSVAIVTDSTAYLSPELIVGAPAAVAVVPLHVVIDGREGREGVDIGAEDVAAALQDFRPVSTSQPAPGEFLAAYQRLADDGAEAIVSVHISGEMSGTVHAADLAAAQSPIPVRVLDSRTIGMAMGYAVLSAAHAAAAGADLDRVAAVARSRAAAAQVVFYVDTLEYLRRGGRIGAAAALLGSALAIKPILAVTDGRIEAVERVRTSARALARMSELVVAAATEATAGGGAVDVAVQHLAAGSRAERAVESLRERLPHVRQFVVSELGAVVGAHVGPGTVTITVCPDSPAV